LLGGGRGSGSVVGGFEILIRLGVASPEALTSKGEHISILDLSKQTVALDRPLHLDCSLSDMGGLFWQAVEGHDGGKVSERI
jgi:hypothetical protein